MAVTETHNQLSISGIERRKHLDGIRIFLFTAVYFCHFGLLENGAGTRVGEFFSYALPVFFVMSGYLITLLIISDSNRSTVKVLKNFYIQRSLRIFPAYYVTLLILVGFGLLTYPWYAAFYAYNLKLFFISWPPISSEGYQYISNWQQENLHLWSLSVEEQFYIIFPVLFLLTSERYRLHMFAALIVSAALIRSWFIWKFGDRYFPPTFGHLVFVTMEYFAWGGLFAYLENRGYLKKINADKLVYIATVIALLLIGWESYLGLLGPFGQAHPSHFQTLIAPALGLWMWSFWKIKESHPMAKPFTNNWLILLGKTCYCNYLVHISCTLLILHIYAGQPALGIVPYYITGYIFSVFVGSLLWYLVERPANRYRFSLLSS